MKSDWSKWNKFYETLFLTTIMESRDLPPGELKLFLLIYCSINSRFSGTPSAEVLRELTDSRYTVYDVLPAFFNHDDLMVRLCELIENI